MATGQYFGSSFTQLFLTRDDMDAWVAAAGANFDPGPQYQGQVWILMNKTNVQTIANQAFANQVTIPGSNVTDLLQNVGSPKSVWKGSAPAFVNLEKESATGTGKKPSTAKGGSGTSKITLLSYLLLLLNTWQGVPSGTGGKFVAGTGNVPKRWIDWLTLLISHYGRYTPMQIYGFLARVDFSGPTFKV